MLISLSGRKQAGKSTLSKLLVKRGFKKISFADRLKQLIAQIFNWDVKILYSNEKEIPLLEPVIWDKDKSDLLSKLTNVSIVFSNEVTFQTPRHAMQYIGTEVLRKHEPNFHVNSLLQSLDPNKNFVCDDMRFKNEFSALKLHNCVNVYIVRPELSEFSNHASETSLLRSDFDYIFLNNHTEEDLKFRFNKFVDAIIDPFNSEPQFWCDNPDSTCKHDIFLHKTYASAYWSGVIYSGFLTGASVKTKIHNSSIELQSSDYWLLDALKICLNSNSCINSVGFNNSFYKFSIDSPWIVDDLKLWFLDSSKQVPGFVQDDVFFNYWLMGLIEGNGSVFYTDRLFGVSLTSFPEIIDFIQEKTMIPCTVSNDGNTVTFIDTNALALYDRIYKSECYSRNPGWFKANSVITKNKGF